MRLPLRRAAAVAAATVVGTTGVVSAGPPAAAADSGGMASLTGAVRTTRSLPYQGNNLVRTIHGDSIWGGYVATGDAYRTVSATWVNPRMSCADGGGTVSYWVGFDGYGNDTVEQIGVDADCTSGSVVYNPWWEMYPGDSHYFRSAEVGDTMTATVTHEGGTWYRLTLTDRTQGWTRTFRDSAKDAGNQSAEVIIEPVGGNGRVPAMPNFGSLRFSRATVDGTPLNSVRTSRTSVTRDRQALADTGALSGAAFTLTWRRR